MGSYPRAEAAAHVPYDPHRKALRRPSKSPEKPTRAARLPTRFPDDDHTYHPLRRVHVAKLQHNTLPPLTASPRDPSTRQRHGHRLANLTDSALWGFPVRYSPSQELHEHWEHARADTSKALVAKAQQHEQAAAAQEAEQHVQRRNELLRHDYALYLHLASRYGALDALLFCCTPFPGRLYALVVDQSVRKLQKWRRERLLALQKYWVVALARAVVESSSQRGVALALRAQEHHRRAEVLLQRLCWRVAARALRAWLESTQRQIEVRWRFQFARQEDVRERFKRWRQRVADGRAFKQQLKQVARRKCVHTALVQWQAWKARHHKLRLHLQTQWTKLQRNCMAQWRVFAARATSERLAATRLQTQWRSYRARSQYTRWQRAVATTTAVVRGFLARRLVSKLRLRFAVVEVVEQMVRALEWTAFAERCCVVRAAAVDKELVRATHEAQYIGQAEQAAAAFVRNELDKVRKNEMHHKLQHKIQVLQEQGASRLHETARGRRTHEALALQAVELLIHEAKAAAREDARRQLLGELASDGLRYGKPCCQRNLCCVCTATANEREQPSIPWAAGYFAPTTGPCPHFSALETSDPTNPQELRLVLSEVLGDFQAHDAQTGVQVLHAAIPVPILWARLHQYLLLRT